MKWTARPTRRAKGAAAIIASARLPITSMSGDGESNRPWEAGAFRYTRNKREYMAANKTVLIVGSGGREHALAWKVASSDDVVRVLVAPGNAGTAREAGVENVPVSDTDIDGLMRLAVDEAVDLTIVGPEAPLAAGIVDRFHAAGHRCFGPTAAAAQLEASKTFSKEFLTRHDIPTADYRVFEDLEQAQTYIRGKNAPLVVKADGLAAGKGVILAPDTETALEAARDMLAGNAFGDSGHRIVVEDWLTGEEASFIVMVDGEHVLPLASSQDHKAALDGDSGPNTGGMGAYSPAPVVTDTVAERILETIIKPTVAGMASEDRPFTGFLYAGLMIDDQGNPKVLEFNVRLGDPEAQPLLMRMTGDFVAWAEAAVDGRLNEIHGNWTEQPALGVVLVAGGYPGSYRKGDPIHGLNAGDDDTIKVFHAGTADLEDDIVTAGGRVLCVCALGDSVADARERAYARAETITWDAVHYRRDIGHRALDRR